MTSPARGGPDTDDKREPCGCRSAYVHDHGCTKFERATGPDTAGMRETLADALLLHCRVGFGPGGEIECVCGWSGQWLSRHQADTLLPVVQRLAVEKAAEAWDQGFEAGHGWWVAGMSGQPVDPPSNPYDALAAAAQPTDGEAGE